MPRGGQNIKSPEHRVNRVTKDINPRTVGMKKSAPPKLNIPGHVPAQTKKWWDMWCRSPLTSDFTEEDWSELMDTAVLHAFFWTEYNIGTPAWFKASAQLRQRTANYGATPLDRQRLRIQFVFAEKGEDEAGTSYSARAQGNKGSTTESPTRRRRGPLKNGDGERPDLKAV